MSEVYRILFVSYFLTKVLGQSSETSPHEVAILWQKYGEVRGAIETLKAKSKYDRRRLKEAENEIAVLKSEVEKLKTECLSNPSPSNTQDGFQQTTPSRLLDEDLHTVPTIHPDRATHDGLSTLWTIFPIKLLKGSIEVKGDSVVFSIDVAVNGLSLSYIWYEDRHPIISANTEYSIMEVQNGSIYKLTLTSFRRKFDIKSNPILIWLIAETHYMSLTFHFTNENKVVTYTDDIIYRISLDSRSDRDAALTGHFMCRHTNFRNKEVEGMIHFFGLNETRDGDYEALSVYGLDNSGPWKEDILVTNSSIWNDEFQMDWMVSKNFAANGGMIEYSIEIRRFDDLFNTVFFYVDDHNTVPFYGLNFPIEFLAIFDVKREFILTQGRWNTIRCSAIGNPIPEVEILKRVENGRLEPIEYPLDLQLSAPLVTATAIIKPKTKASNESYECVVKTEDKEIRHALKSKVMVPPSFSHTHVERTGNKVMINLSVKRGDPPKPHVMCSENDIYGPSIYGRPEVYGYKETSTDDGYNLNIWANFTGITNPPTRLVCLMFSSNGNDRVILHL